MAQHDEQNTPGRGLDQIGASRRDILRWGGALALAAPVIAASGLGLGPATVGAQVAYTDSPFLAERVASGALPPVAERLPAEPFVVGPGVLLQEEFMTWENGTYGGDYNLSAMHPTALINIAGGSTILRSPSQTTELSRPNVVSEFSASDDFTVFSFKIRAGLKWSDGAPVTTEDVRFSIEDLYNNLESTIPWPTQLYTQGNTALAPATLTVVDELAFQLTFAGPYGYLVADLNSWIPSYDILFKPSHYLKQFHAGHAEAAALEALVAETEELSWSSLLTTKNLVHWDVGMPNALGMPVLNAWVLAESNESRSVFERNPFFWHVDSDGRQLPYVDRIVVNIVGDADAVSNGILAGQVTLATGNEVALNQMPIYQQNAERSGLSIFTSASFNYPISLFLNQDFGYEDPASVWQALVADPEHRFGKALAASMDGADVNRSVYFGLYGDALLNNTGHDPALAAQMLDGLGMTARDGDGFRLGPDGNPFILRITNPGETGDFAPIAVLLREQIGAAGIRVEIDNVAVSLWDERKETNEIMASIHWNDGPAWSSGISEDYLPVSKGPWSPMTWLHFTSQGKEGRQPPAYLAEFYRLHTARKAFPPASPEGVALFTEMLAWMSDNYVFIPTTGGKIGISVVDERLRNGPNEGSPCELDTYINAEAMWFASA